MDLEWKNVNVYDLVTQLIKHMLQKNFENKNYYILPRSNTKTVKALRSKAFEILLNKSDILYNQGNVTNSKIDPILEILKYAFVLKCSLRRISEAEKLENLITELLMQEINIEIIHDPVLKLLVDLKNIQVDTGSLLDVFHYGKTNPLLPEDISTANSISKFQTYPMECFVLSEKFEAMLNIRKTYRKQDAANNFVSRISFENQYISKTILGIDTIDTRYNIIEIMPISNYTDQSILKRYNIVNPFMTYIMHVNVEQTNRLYLSTKKFISNLSLPCGWIKSIENKKKSENNLYTQSDNFDHNIVNKIKHVRDNNLIWKEMKSSNNHISKLRTWESLGSSESCKQALFITDLSEATLHLAKIRQTSILSLLPKKTIDYISLMREISLDKFLLDIKLLLFGIDSDSFKYDNLMGFRMEENIIVYGISSEMLMITCKEAICWGNSFKSLSCLITPDPQTGKLQQDGLIFRAMCANVKEFLLYYRMALQRVLNQYKFHGLLNLFKKVRPLAHLTVEVARLCGCNRYSQFILGRGSAILTHIYKEVTNVTDPKIALVFYSILKSCCEVYFRLLQNWLFEGTCNDIYGEFMIQTRSQYLRKRGRKFWTEGFAIDTESVPGFLSDLTESILQCGKTLRLLKICSPKNPVCNVSMTTQPEIRVCLSMSMLREQLSRCQEYKYKGEAALGPVVSLLSAIQEEKKAEKQKANFVICIQQETLSRIKKQQEEFIAKTVQNKQALLQTLKDQAVENALFKEKKKELEILADKLLLEKINREQEEMLAQQRIEREHLISYYNKLAANTQKNRMRYSWRKTRMNYFERRVEFLESEKKLDRTMSKSIAIPNSNETDIEQSKNIPISTSAMNVSTSDIEFVSSQDENSNFAENEVSSVVITNDSNGISLEENLSPFEVITANTDTPSAKNHNFDNGNIFDKEITKNKETITRTNMQNVYLPGESLPWSYIYKKNNERSNLQDFLRNEAMKNICTVTDISDKQMPNLTTLDARLNIWEANKLTEKIIGIIDRPKSLVIEKIDNMIAAQANKFKVLSQEYGMTPNNNEYNTVFIDKQQMVDHMNINENNHVSLNITNDYNTENIKENVNNNIFPTSDVKLPEEITILYEFKNNVCGERLNRSNLNNKNKAQEPILNNTQQQNIADTPMSCTTDNFTTSTHTPLSQIQNSNDIFALNINHETSSLSDVSKSIMEETCFDSLMNNFKLSNLFDISPNVQPVTLSSLTIADVEMIDHTSLQVYLEKSIIIPLQIQSRLINNAIIKYLVNEHNILLHLHSLRSYFFLLNGEFAKSLTDSLYSRLYTISAPNDLFNSAILTKLLEKALMNSFSDNYINSELLSLSAVDTPSELYISDPNVLDCLCLNYKMSWPLNIILDDTMMLQYSKVFKFLIMTGRVSWVLQEDFNIMKIDRNVVISEQYHKLQLYRHSMMQFMNALHNYLTCNVLYASWNEFEKDLQNSRTIDQIYVSHMNYIKKILSRCMLNTRGETMRVCLMNIFKIILKFHNRLRSQGWIIGNKGQYYSHPNFKSLEQMYQSFCEWRAYMAHVAHKLTVSGYQPHLSHFLHALNINHMYNLTKKQ